MTVKVKELLSCIEEFNPIYDFSIDCSFNSYSLLNNNINVFHPNCLYIGKASLLPADPPSKNVTFLIVKDVNLPNYEKEDCQCHCIYVPSNTDIWQLFNKVQSYFNEIAYVANCCNEIIQLSNNTNSLQKLMDLGYELLGNPLLLVDASLNFIAHSGGNTVNDEPVWKWVISKGYMPEEYVDSLLLDGFAEEEKYLQKPLLIWQKNYLNHDQLVYRILSNNIPVGYLKVLQYNKPISESHKKIITVLGNCLCKFLNNDAILQASCSPLITSFLLSLLNGNLYDHDIIDMRMHQFNFKLYDNLVLILIELSNTFIHDKGKCLIFKRKVQNLLGRDNILFYKNNLVIIYDFKSSNPFTSAEEKNFESLLSAYDCRAGISLVFHDLYSLPEHYQNAHDALYTSKKLNMDKSIIYYSDIVLQHILLSYANQNDLKALIHPAIRTIQKIEPDKSDMFLETIKAYINNGMKIVPTSKALFTHYNTIKYRLNRIAELTNLDFDDANTIFQLQISFIILDILKGLKM